MASVYAKLISVPVAFVVLQLLIVVLLMPP